MAKLTITALGGTREVGKSALLLEAGRTRVLLDYGMKLIPKQHPEFPPLPDEVDAVLLSHAHLDHSGSIPRLFASGKEVPVYALDVTKHYTELLLYDTIKVAKIRDHEIGYGARDVNRFLESFRQIEFNVPFKVGDIEVTAIDAGHIPGSAMFHISYDGKSILYTGDFNTVESRLMPSARLDDVPDVDVVITESTYAKREHPPRDKQEMLLRDAVMETISSGGTAIIAGFAIGRLLEVAMALRARGFRGDLFLDGMARKSTEITAEFSNRVRSYDEMMLTIRSLLPVKDWGMRERISRRPSVVLTTSGMLEGGPVHYYLKERKDDENSMITLTGYQVDGSEGRRLLEEGKIEIGGEENWINMKVNQLNFSAHASRSGILKLIRELGPKEVIVVHGDRTSEFALELEERMGVKARAPEVDETIEL
ncbi:MAG: MBL fold metallo-hydrolase [Candidatus Korarchaeota archaeon NZ13-K]|nr:MAG: MBL fold metallo-hydrolase [Candidatus Korarchaeota archaeon NZ13-K]